MEQHFREAPSATDLLHVRLLGAPAIRFGDRWHTRFRSHRIPALLGYLALRGGPVDRFRVAADLWPGADEPTSRHNLRQILLLTKRLAGDAIQSQEGKLLLSPEHCSTDLWRLRRLARTPAPDLEALEFLGGMFLEGVDDDWAIEARMEVEELRLQLARQLAPSLSTVPRQQALELLEPLGSGPAIAELRRGLLGTKGSSFDAFAYLRTRPQEALRLAVAMTPSWLAAGRTREGLAQLEDALGTRAALPAKLVAQATLGQARLALAMNDAHSAMEICQELDESKPFSTGSASWVTHQLLKIRVLSRQQRYAQALDTVESLCAVCVPKGQFGAAAEAGLRRTTIYILQNRIGECLHSASLAASYAERSRDSQILGQCLESLSAALRFNGRFADAMEAAKRAHTLLAPLEAPGELAIILARLGRNLEGLGDTARARAAYQGAVDALEGTDDTRALAEALVYLADLHNREGRYDLAAPLHERAARLRRELSEAFGEATAQRGLGIARLAMGRADEAEAPLRLASQAFRTFNPLAVASALVPLAESLAHQGKLGAARRAIEQALTIMCQYDELTRERHAPGDLLSIERARRVSDRVRAKVRPA